LRYGEISQLILAMTDIHQAKARNFPVVSVGSLLDEPFTGVVYLKDSGITTDFRTLKGKRIGYVGEFGKVRNHITHRRTSADMHRSKSTSSPPTTACHPPTTPPFAAA
jgi:ABC-type nitrate/sulfonate/bicarbonate transport system substrate-binding protein